MKKLSIIAFILFAVIFYIIFTQAMTSAKVKRVECQAQTTTFEKIFVEDPITEGIDALESGNYVVNSTIEYSKNMESNLKDKLYIEDLDKLLTSTISKYIKEEKTTENKVYINYYLYENDKKDENKTNTDAKKYPGYLMFDFKYDKKLIYKIQTDYANIDGNDIQDRMECVIKSFTSIKGK